VSVDGGDQILFSVCGIPLVISLACFLKGRRPWVAGIHRKIGRSETKGAGSTWQIKFALGRLLMQLLAGQKKFTFSFAATTRE